MISRLLVFSVLIVVSFAGLKRSCWLNGGYCSRHCTNGQVDSTLKCFGRGTSCCIKNVDPSKLPGQENCGVSRTSFIVNGQEANPHEYPWMVSFHHNYLDFHFCGGSLITPEWVVTAAHCVFGDLTDTLGDFRVILGEHDRTQVSGREIERNVVKIIRHDCYADGLPWPNDIALLKLDSPVPLGGDINTLCLPQVGENFTDDDNCWITGWGRSEGTANETILQELRADIRTREECMAPFEELIGPGYILPTHICSSYRVEGVCGGDSGGPMQCARPGEGRFKLAGITSWGYADCLAPGYPGIFTKASAYVDWIYKKIMEEQD